MSTFDLSQCPKDLQILRLSYNRLKELDLFKCPRKLKEISLGGNFLEKVIGDPPEKCKVYPLNILRPSLLTQLIKIESIYLTYLNLRCAT